MVDLRLGDCLELMKNIPDGSVDLVLTDPPYGTVKGAPLDGWSKADTQWDVVIDTEKLFSEIKRVLRQNGKAVLFCQEPFTTELINHQNGEFEFLYKIIWEKNNAANVLMSKKAMISRYEEICVFGKPHDAECTNELRDYFRRVLDFIGAKSCKEINAKLGHRKAEHCFYVTEGKRAIKDKIGGKADHTTRKGSSQFSLCTEQTYNEIVSIFGIDKMEGFMSYSKLSEINKKYLPVFNLWEGKPAKINILKYGADKQRFHPTQKPVKLLEDLIQTYSNEGNTVLDFTMGSGSTGVACVNTNRNFIGIELDEGYFNIARKRIEEAQEQIKIAI